MRDLSCDLITSSITKDSIGVETITETKTTIPIIRIEDVYAKEFYDANERGYRPSLRLRISTLNFNNEEELDYNGVRYSIIRTQDLIDELILVCERKVKCKKSNQNNLEQPYPSI